MNFIRREREWQHTFRLPLYSQQLHSQSGALPDFPPFKSDFSTWSKFWVYVHSMCTFQTTFLRIRRMQVKHSPIPRLLPTFSLLPYYKQQKAMMMVWEWDCDGGLGMSETVMEAWELGCDGGLGMRLGWRTANVVKANNTHTLIQGHSYLCCHSQQKHIFCLWCSCP